MTASGARTLDEALAALAESEARHHALFEKGGVVQLIVDRDSGAILRASAAAEQFYGWPRAAIHAMLIIDLDGTSLEEWNLMATQDGALVYGTHRVAAGDPRKIEACLVPITVDRRPAVHVIVHDIGERARAEAALQAAELHLASLRQRAGTAGHDFNNVLTVLRGSAAFLQDAIAPDSPSQEDILALERATDRAEELVRDLVALVRQG